MGLASGLAPFWQRVHDVHAWPLSDAATFLQCLSPFSLWVRGWVGWVRNLLLPRAPGPVIRIQALIHCVCACVCVCVCAHFFERRLQVPCYLCSTQQPC